MSTKEFKPSVYTGKGIKVVGMYGKENRLMVEVKESGKLSINANFKPEDSDDWQYGKGISVGITTEGIDQLVAELMAAKAVIQKLAKVTKKTEPVVKTIDVGGVSVPVTPELLSMIQSLAGKNTGKGGKKGK